MYPIHVFFKSTSGSFSVRLLSCIDVEISGTIGGVLQRSSSVLTVLPHISLPRRRFVLNETLFNELVEASRDIPGNRWTVGGNAPVMAGRMATEGCDVLLGGSFSPDFTDVLSQHITGVCTLRTPTPLSGHYQVPFPHLLHMLSLFLCVFAVAGEEVEEPDIHLILEYPSGASWGQYTSRRANRCVCVFIVHYCASTVNYLDD